MSTTPEALRLADVLTRADAAATQLTNRLLAAAELRRLADVEAERDELKRIRARVIRERDQLRAEVEALRPDAERFRWLRDESPGEWTLQVGDLPLFKGDLGAAIDRERQA